MYAATLTPLALISLRACWVSLCIAVLSGFDVEVPGELGVAASTDFDDCADAFVVDGGDAIHL